MLGGHAHVSYSCAPIVFLRCCPRPHRHFLLLNTPPSLSLVPLHLSSNSTPYRPRRSHLSLSLPLRRQGGRTMDEKEKCDEVKKPYTKLRLWEFPNQYILEPLDVVAETYLAVSRDEGSLNLIGELPERDNVASKLSTIYGVLGMLRLLAGSCLLVITERECVGSYLGHSTYKVSGLRILPCNSTNNSSTEQKKLEDEFSVLMSAAKRTSGLYFSYDVNLTLRAQKLYDLGDVSKELPLWAQADPRFVWNGYMLEPLIENKLGPYVLPVIQGNYQNFKEVVGVNTVDVTLISRRCTRRTGTRMWRRGADSEGYVANFVETEQILQANGYMASFVQVRGSIPFMWEQIVDLRYKPDFEIVKPEEAPRVVERHFLDLSKRYGSVLAVDLVNKHGGEGRLSQMFANAMQTVVSDKIRYIHFDFHRVCGHIHFEELSQLYQQMEDYLKNHGYFLLNAQGEKLQEQTGVVRSNCIDCLDRTNVTQSMIAGKMLEIQLIKLGLFGADETISAHQKFDTKYKIMWANHGDEISIQYSGTPALKGDFVRFGKRTVQGILQDGWNALSRYYLNNFSDGTKQDAMDLLHGHYITSVSRDMRPLSRAKGLKALASFRLAFALVFAGVIFTVMSLRQARHDTRHLLHSFVWASLSMAIAAFVKANGRMFTNRPRLSLR